MKASRWLLLALPIMTLTVRASAQDTRPQEDPSPSAQWIKAPPRSAPPAGVPAEIDAALAQLGSDDYAQRNAAEKFLLSQNPRLLEIVEFRLALANNPEVQIRLRQIASHLYLKAQTSMEGEASVLGISLAIESVKLGPLASDVHMAVAVVEVQPGFPAAEILQAGDRIIAVDHQPLPDNFGIDEFRAGINSRKPGGTVLLTILRSRQKMDVTVPLIGLRDASQNTLAEFVRIRAERLLSYREYLRARSPSSPIVVMPDAEDTSMQPPLKDPLNRRID